MNRIISEAKTTLLCFLMLIAVTLVLPQCTGRHSYPDDLSMADSLCRTNPDSAVSYIKALSKKYANTSDGYNRNYYLLLTVKAANNAYKPLKDSTIFHVMDFYEKANDTEKLCQTYYYVGKHFVQKNDAPQALQYFQKSLDLTDEKTPLSFLSCIYSQTGSLFMYQAMFDDALQQYEKSFTCDSIAKDTISMLYSMRDIATIYDFKEDYSSCLSILKQAYKMARYTNDSGLTNTITLSLAICYKDVKNYHESKRFLLETLSQIDPDVKSAAFSLAIDLYSKENKTDSVFYFSNALLNVGTVYSKQKAAMTLCKYFSGKDDSKSALCHLEKATSLTDSMNRINAVNTVARMHFAYNYNRQEKEKLLIANTAQKEKYAYAISVLVLLLIIAFAIYLLERSKKKHLESQLLCVRVEKQLDESRKLIIEKDVNHKREINNLCAKNEAERQEYERRLHDVEDKLAKELEKHKEK